MNWLKRNLKYLFLSMFVLTNGLIISESSLSGGASGLRSRIVSLILSGFVNKTIPGSEKEYIPVTSLTVQTHDKKTITDDFVYYIPLGITRRVTSTVLPKDATDKSLRYTSSNSSIVDVYPGGYLEARSLGENVEISVLTSSDEVYTKFFVTVHEKVAPTNFTASLEKEAIVAGTTTKLNLNLSDTQLKENDIYKLQFYTTNENIVQINRWGIVKGINPGTAEIGIVGHKTTYPITVLTPSTPVRTANEIILDIPSFGYVYDYTPINYSFDIENVTDPSVTIVSNNEAIAKIEYRDDKYYIYGTKVNGTATITVYLNTSIDLLVKSEHQITMQNVIPSHLTISTSKNEVSVGSTLTITTSLTHNIAGKENLEVTDKRISFTSSDKSIATVNASNLNGVVVGIKPGKVIITARSVSNPELVESIEITVVPVHVINDQNFNDFQSFIRKAFGHFMLFFVNGLFGFLTFYLFFKEKKNRILKTVASSLPIGLLFAVISEVIQLYVPGRAGLAADVLIDFSGYLLATSILLVIVFLRYKRQKKVSLTSLN